MYFLVCRESGLDCDFLIKGETKEFFTDHKFSEMNILNFRELITESGNGKSCHAWSRVEVLTGLSHSDH